MKVRKTIITCNDCSHFCMIVVKVKMKPSFNYYQQKQPDRMIEKSNIKLLEVIGQGEYNHAYAYTLMITFMFNQFEYV